MTPHFEVGEIAVLRHSADWPEYVGMECEVIGPLKVRTGLGRDGKQYTIECYDIRMTDGKEFYTVPESLRKKRPPRADLAVVSWKSCPWKPSKVTA